MHVVTSNDYLVARDANALRSLYGALGLSVDAVTQDLDADRRRRAYACDIAYCTAKELAFDYLRDGVSRRRAGSELQQRVARLDARDAAAPATVLRGLCMAIIDEADSILIDEARVPLILSQSHGNAGERDYYGQALRLAAAMSAPRDFHVVTESRTVELTAAGREQLERDAAALDAVWRNRGHREETVC